MTAHNVGELFAELLPGHDPVRAATRFAEGYGHIIREIRDSVPGYAARHRTTPLARDGAVR